MFVTFLSHIGLPPTAVGSSKAHGFLSCGFLHNLWRSHFGWMNIHLPPIWMFARGFWVVTHRHVGFCRKFSVGDVVTPRTAEASEAEAEEAEAEEAEAEGEAEAAGEAEADLAPPAVVEIQGVSTGQCVRVVWNGLRPFQLVHLVFVDKKGVPEK